MVITLEHIQHGSGGSQSPYSYFPTRTLFEHWSTHEQACLEVFQLIKVMPKLLIRKKIFCELLEPYGVFCIFLLSELACYRLCRFQCVV